MPSDPLSRSFAALADPTRRALLVRLGEGEATVGELAAPFSVSFQAIAKHVQVLEEAGLVAGEKVGRTKRLRLVPERTADVASWLEDHRRRADARYRRLDALLAALHPAAPPSDARPSDTRPSDTRPSDAPPSDAPASPSHP